MRELAAAVLVAWPLLIWVAIASPTKSVKGFVAWLPVGLSLALAVWVLS